MKKYVISLLTLFLCVFVVNPATVFAAPEFEELPVTVVDDMRDYDTDVTLSAVYVWTDATDAEGNYGEVKYGTFTLKEDSIVRIKMTDDSERITMNKYFGLYGNNSLAVSLLDKELGSYEDHYIRLKAEWCAGKVEGMPFDAKEATVLNDTVVITLDKTAKGWYTIEFKSDTTGYCDRDEVCRVHVYVEGIKEPAVREKTYVKNNVKYKVTRNYLNGTGNVTVLGMKKNRSSVTIPKTVKLNDYIYNITKIEKKAFYGKAKLKKVTISAATIKTFGKNAFKGVNKKAVFYVPRAKYRVYSTQLKKVGVVKPMRIKKK